MAEDKEEKSVIYCDKPKFSTTSNSKVSSPQSMTHSVIDLSMQSFNLSSGSDSEHRRLILVRNAEQLDRAFGNWTKLAFVSGEYRPYDLNQPLTLPKRAGSPHTFIADCPLTEIGTATAQLIGRGMNANRVLALISSPALRCVQTAHNMAKEMPTMPSPTTDVAPISVCVEPALFDFVGHCPILPCWMTTAEFVEDGHSINRAYVPIDSQKTCQHRQYETMKEYRNRCKDTVAELLQRFRGSGDIVLVTHGLTIHWIMRTLLETVPPVDSLNKVYPFGSVVVLEKSDGEWRRVDNAAPAITYVGYCTRALLSD